MKLLPLFALLLSAAPTAAAFAGTPAAPAPAKPSAAASAAPIGNARAGTARNAPLLCPVSGDKIASPKAAYSSEVYKGKTYYFCCPDCKPAFDKNPAKYVKLSLAKSASK